MDVEELQRLINEETFPYELNPEWEVVTNIKVVEAARLVANPNIEAAAGKFLDCDSALATDLTGWDRKLWAAEQAIAAALTRGDTKTPAQVFYDTGERRQ